MGTYIGVFAAMLFRPFILIQKTSPTGHIEFLFELKLFQDGHILNITFQRFREVSMD